MSVLTLDPKVKISNVEEVVDLFMDNWVENNLQPSLVYMTPDQYRDYTLLSDQFVTAPVLFMGVIVHPVIVDVPKKDKFKK